MSKIEVNKIGPQCGTTLTVGCGAGQTVVADAATVTLGRCGGTVALASGATQTGFGRTGTVDWQTGSVKTATFSASNGEGYFCNTSGGAFTANLPAGSAGAIVSLADYAGTWQTHNLTVAANGTDKIGSVPGASIALSTEGQSVTLVFVDSTQGWINTMDSTSNVRGNPNLVATGGTVTTSGDCKIHTFTGPGTFSVTSTAVTAANNIVSYLVVAGGGGGGHDDGGGGGAGGFREYKGPATPYTASPLNGNPCGTAVTLTATSYPITVGGGGAGAIPGSNCTACNGVNSVFSTITSAGGGFGNRNDPAAGNGGSGGGGKPGSGPGGSGNTPPVAPPQGQNGGTGTPGANQGGGGGGASAVGGNASGSAPSGTAGPGGAGVTTSINASPVAYAGGGGGGAFGTRGSGGSGGGGAGAQYPSTQADAGTANTGGGGGGGSTNTGPRDGKNGGSGIVILRYKYQ